MFDHDANEFGFTCAPAVRLRPAYRAPSMTTGTKLAIFGICCACVGAVYMLAHFLKG